MEVLLYRESSFVTLGHIPITLDRLTLTPRSAPV